jgi:hypothetical protein
MCRFDRPTLEETCAEFKAKMAAAIETGEFHYVYGTSLDTDTLAAIAILAQEFPKPSDESIMLAHAEFELQLDGTHIQWLSALFANAYPSASF